MNMTKKGGMGITFSCQWSLFSYGARGSSLLNLRLPTHLHLNCFLRGLLSCLVFLVMVLIARVKFPPVKVSLSK